MRRVCLDAVHTLARDDRRIAFVGSDLGPGTLAAMREEMPERFFMEGIAEQHIVGMAAGLAMEGLIPYVNTIATFLTRRCFEQVAVDLCMHDLPVRLIGNGGGVVYAPLGPTHLATDDLALMTALPNMSVVAPCDAEEMARLMPLTVDHPGPLYIRLAKGGDRVVSREEHGFAIGKAILLRAPGEVLFVTTGVTTQRALEAAELLAGAGIGAGVLHNHTVKPLDREALNRWGRTVKLLVSVEEHSVQGGLGAAVAAALLERGGTLPEVMRLGLPDAFPDRYGSQESLMARYGLQGEQLAKAVRERLA